METSLNDDVVNIAIIEAVNDHHSPVRFVSY